MQLRAEHLALIKYYGYGLGPHLNEDYLKIWETVSIFT